MQKITGLVVSIDTSAGTAVVELGGSGGERVTVFNSTEEGGAFFSDISDHQRKEDVIGEFLAGNTGIPVFVDDTIEMKNIKGAYYVLDVVLKDADPRNDN